MPWLELMQAAGIAGPQAGDVFPLDGDETVIGRDPTPPGPGVGLVHLPHHAVSRWHARISRTPDGYAITDLGTRGGHYLNAQSLSGGHRAPLADGDRLKVCDYLFVFREGPAPAAPAAATVPEPPAAG